MPDIMKATSCLTPEGADYVDALCSTMITAGTHKAATIRVAEAAKVIENTQRDLNVALISELALIFNRMGIETEAVLKVAGTKWSFLNFRPGRFGGHCIGLDPYYPTHKAEAVGHHPQIILSGRRVNDGMGQYVADQVIKALIDRQIHAKESRVLILGLTFNENCPDVRNTRVVEVRKALIDWGAEVEVCDPWVHADEVRHEYGFDVITDPSEGAYAGIILAVAPEDFRSQAIGAIRRLGKSDHLLYDLKYLFDADQTDVRL